MHPLLFEISTLFFFYLYFFREDYQNKNKATTPLPPTHANPTFETAKNDQQPEYLYPEVAPISNLNYVNQPKRQISGYEFDPEDKQIYQPYLTPVEPNHYECLDSFTK